MANKTISGTLSIPAGEPATAGTYTDLIMKLYFVDGLDESLEQTSPVTTANTYSFTYLDEGQQVKVKLVRVSTSTVLASSATRGVLPRSFLLTTNDAQYYSNFIHRNYTFDAGAAIIACAGGRYFELAQEIAEGILDAATVTGSTIPFAANHVDGTSEADAYYRTGTVAMVAYSLGFYLEHNPTASNIVAVANTLQDLLGWLSSQKNSTTGLYKAGTGRYVAGVLEPSYVDTNQYLVDQILVYFAYKQAGRILNTALFGNSAALAENIMDNFYDSSTNLFRSALLQDGTYHIVDNLEVNIYGAFFLVEEGFESTADIIMEHIEQNFTYLDVTNNVKGYKGTTTDTKLWYEGSYAVSMLYYKLNNLTQYSAIRKSLNKLLNDDGSFRYGIIKDGLVQVLDYKSVGSTAFGFMANQVPEYAFSVSTGSTLSGLPVVYYNTLQSQAFTRNDCTLPATGTTVNYTVPAGTYSSTVSVDDANSQALAAIAASGQDNANAVGQCQLPNSYFNTERIGYFRALDCGAGYVGSTIEYSIPANSFGSSISQQHANALADVKLFTDGQAYADLNSVCIVNPVTVDVSVSSTYSTIADSDEHYAYIITTAPVATTLTVDSSYSFDGGATWVPNPTQYINTGASNSFSFYVTTQPTGSVVQHKIDSVTPANYSSSTVNQIYNWDGTPTLYPNDERKFYFIKSGCTSISAASVVEFTASPGVYDSTISVDDANAQADLYMAEAGPAYANAAGICGNTTSFANTEQSQVFTKAGCASPEVGSDVTYTVPAGTYISSVSVDAANDYALLDIAANGQNFADMNGTCSLPSNYVTVSMQTRVDSFGLYDDVYVRALTDYSHPVNTDLNVSYDFYNPDNNSTEHGSEILELVNGTWLGAWFYVGQFQPGNGNAVTVEGLLITPDNFAGINYIF